MNLSNKKFKNNQMNNKEIVSVFEITPTTNNNVCLINPIILSCIIIFIITLIIFIINKFNGNNNKYKIIK